MVGPECLRPHFLDSSALVKLVVDEPNSAVLQAYFRGNSWFVTSPLCIAEAINVLKRKWSKHELTDQQYHYAVWETSFPYRDSGRIQLINKNLGDPQTFFGAQTFSSKYGVDFADALQLYLMVRGSRTMTDARPCAVLISADTKLTSSARNEGLLAWNCVHESSPPAAALGWAHAVRRMTGG